MQYDEFIPTADSNIEFIATAESKIEFITTDAGQIDLIRLRIGKSAAKGPGAQRRDRCKRHAARRSLLRIPKWRTLASSLNGESERAIPLPF